MTNSFERVREAVESAGLRWRETRAGQSASFQTPGHSPQDLGSSVVYDGQSVGLTVFNGDKEDVLTDLGLTWIDLFDNPKGSEYHYPDGRIAYRAPQKKFYQKGNTKGTALYGSEHVPTTPGTVYVVEGERDVNTARTVCQVAAVTQAMGASQDPAKADWSPLQGRDVIIVRDNDEPGHKRAGKVYTHLEAMKGNRPASIRVVDVAAGKDLSDHIATGHGLDQLVTVEMEGPPRRAIKLLTASSVLTERLDWLIDNWIPKRSLTLLAGREGLGKSTIACDIAAQATRGELDGAPMNVAYLNTEDSRSITVKPRLQAAGADLDRVFFIDVTTEEGKEGALTLPGDTSLLSAALVQHNVKLIILDAAKSAMHSSLDGYRDDDVRQFLEPLASMCDRHDMAIVGLVHFGKRESNDPGKLILGSVAWSQIARSVLSVALDDEGTLVVTNTKGNLAPAQISREARIESTVIPTDDGKTADVGRIVWGDQTNVSAADLLVSHDSEEEDDRTDAEAWLEDYLADNGETPRADVFKAAAKDRIASERTIKRAFKKLGGVSRSSGFPRVASWSLPSRATPPENTPHALQRGPTGPTVVDLHKHNGPTGNKTQLGHTQEHGPTGQKTAPNRPNLTLLHNPQEPEMTPTTTPQTTQSRRVVSEGQSVILDVLSEDHFLSIRTIKGCFTVKQLETIGDLDAALVSLLNDGLVEADGEKYRKVFHPVIA